MIALEAEILNLLRQMYNKDKLLSTLAEFKTVGTTTWTVPTGIKYAYISMVAGGGGGGGGSTADDGGYNKAGGGGGGGKGIWRWLVTGLTPGVNISVTVGAGGTGGAGGSGTGGVGATGVTGGTTSFGASNDSYYLLCAGGAGGFGGDATSGHVISSGGYGGGGTRGGVTLGSADAVAAVTASSGMDSLVTPHCISGAGGGSAYQATYLGHAVSNGGSSVRFLGGVPSTRGGGAGGGGGASYFGSGGNGGYQAHGSTPSVTGEYGGGGGGAGCGYGIWHGGDGAQGYCLIEYPLL